LCHVGGTRTAEVRGELIDPIDEGRIAVLHVLLQASLVRSCLLSRRSRVTQDLSADLKYGNSNAKGFYEGGLDCKYLKNGKFSID
jgi:hypothetical protein